jgi:protein-L-isoaspartate(D-aspartate) O-methyltransferase
MADVVTRRKNMVESQVRPSDVTDRRITAAMQSVAREAFVPESLADLAYIDDPLTVAPGRALMAPRTFARLLQLADVSETDKVLIVGGLSGYSTMVVSRLAREVVTLECEEGLFKKLKSSIAEAGLSNVAAVSGPLVSGWEQAAPYDAIFVEGGVEREPSELILQLVQGGRLVCIDLMGAVGRATVMQRVSGNGQSIVSRRAAFDASAACLPGFERKASFVF